MDDTARLARAREVAKWLLNYGNASEQHAAMLITDALDADESVTAAQIVEWAGGTR
jgi:hypothetical protein